MWSLNFFNRKYIINNNQIYAQDEQMPVNEELQNKDDNQILKCDFVNQLTP
jgi:hypothetical protein